MKAFNILALLLPLLGCALAAAAGGPIVEVACQEFTSEEFSGLFTNFGDQLQEDTREKTNLVKSIVSRIVRNGLFKRYYTYTVSAGFLAATKNKKAQLFAKVERTDGQGLGTLFRVNFFDKNSQTLKVFAIYPNQRCTIDTTYTRDQIGMITAAYRRGDS